MAAGRTSSDAAGSAKIREGLSWRHKIILAESNALRRLRAYDRVLLITMSEWGAAVDAWRRPGGPDAVNF